MIIIILSMFCFKSDVMYFIVFVFVLMSNWRLESGLFCVFVCFF